MTFTADALRLIIGNNTGVAFAKKTGISQPNISRYLNGENRMDGAALAIILKVVSDPAQKSALITAWVRDQVPGPVGEEIEIAFASKKSTAAARRLPKLSPRTEELLRYWWKEAAKDPQVGITLSALRKLRN